MARWLAESFRTTVFAPDIDAVKLKSYPEVLGVEPAQTLKNTTNNTMQEGGPYRGRTITIARQIGRADLAFLPVITPSPTPPPAPYNLGKLDEVLTDIRPVIQSWLEQVQKVDRLACGAILAVSGKELREVNEIVSAGLASVVAMKVEPHDLFLQMNLPRTSKVDATSTINRVTKWMTQSIQLFPVDLATGLAQKSVLTQLRAQLELDINTAPRTEGIDGKHVRGLIDEMLDIMVEIADKGFQP